MSRGNSHRWMRTSLAVSLLCLPLVGQSNSAPPPLYLTRGNVPFAFSAQLRAIGDRVGKPGYERSVLTGTLMTAGGGTVPVTITQELGGKLRLEADSKTLVLNEVPSLSLLNKIDSNLLESLVDDTAENLLDFVARGNGYRVIGRGFPQPGGRTCDVYTSLLRLKSRSAAARWTRYCFDGETGWLLYSEYEDPERKGTFVRTEFTGWHVVNGQAFPARIVRMEGSAPVFTLNLATAVVSARRNDGLFGR